MKSCSYEKKGSQRWLQVAVERAHDSLDRSIRSAMNVGDDVGIKCLSPVREEGFIEYSGGTEFTKAHIAEIVSTSCRAKGTGRKHIVRSMRAVQKALAPKSVDFVNWTGTFYQYANRVAYLHFLRHDNGVPAHLVNIYFMFRTGRRCRVR
jgi:hypothetical protein